MKLGLDKDTEYLIGKLMVNQKDEKVNADTATFSKLYTMMGGSLTIVIFGVQIIFFKFMEVYKTSV